MKQLPSKLFPGCSLPSQDSDVGFFDIVPQGFDHEVFLYLSEETVEDDDAVKAAAAFFDQALHWNTLCRTIFLSFGQGSEDGETVQQFFDFYKEEVPEVFGVDEVSVLSVEEMVKRLHLKGMASHGSGGSQRYVVDFTLGYDQILCVKFDRDGSFESIAWES